ncbi:MAG: hypothetical protein OHK0017_01180 [Patescibacteria group bacterium]
MANSQYPSWMTAKYLNRIARDLQTNCELNFAAPIDTDSLFESLEVFYTKKNIPSDANYILNQAKGLLADEASIIAHRLSTYNQINLYELADPNAEDIFPLVYELMDRRMLNTYVAAGNSNFKNEYATQKINFLTSYSGQRLNFGSMITDLDSGSFNKNTKVFKTNSQSDDSPTNLFVLLNSTLGNMINPERALNNISRSMESGDLFMLSQAIYSPGSEDTLVSDYRNNLANLSIYREMASVFDPGSRILTNWDDQKIQGINISVKVEKDMELAGAELKEGQQITLLRSTRFNDAGLKKMLINASFRIISIAYDDDMNFGLYFVQKR